jgi:hypothetical protein
VDIMKFHVCRDDRSGQWVVRLNDAAYGTYLDKDQALSDAIDAAGDAHHVGREAEVWLQNQVRDERVL